MFFRSHFFRFFALVALLFSPAITFGQLERPPFDGADDLPRGSAASKAEQDEFYKEHHQKPTVPTTCPAAPAVDLADEAASYRALAQLACFCYGINENFGENFVTNALGQDFCDSELRAMTATIEFDYLMQSKDPAFRKAVQDVREIYFENWRIDEGDLDFGQIGFKQPNTELAAVFAAGLASALTGAFDDVTAEKGKEHYYTDSNGRVCGYRDPDPPHDPSALTQILQADLDRHLQQMSQDTDQRRQTSQVLMWIQGERQAELAAVWESEILLHLVKSYSATPSQTLIAAVFRRPDALEFKNNSGKTLHHVTLLRRYKDNAGDAHYWFGHVDSVGPRDAIYPVLLPYFYLAPRPASSMDSGPDWQVFSDEGIQSGTLEWNVAFSSKNNVKMTGDELKAEERLAYARAPELSSLFRELYPTPQNSQKARGQLLAAVNPHGTYHAEIFRNPDNLPTPSIHYYLQFDFKAVPATKGLINCDVSRVVDPAAKPPYYTGLGNMQGKLVEELERGCAIGLIPSAAQLQTDLNKKLQQNAKARSAGLQRPSADPDAKEQIANLGEPKFSQFGRVITSPTVRRRYYVPKGSDVAGAGIGAALIYVEQQIANAPFTRRATYVITCSDKGQLYLETGMGESGALPFTVRLLDGPAPKFAADH